MSFNTINLLALNDQTSQSMVQFLAMRPLTMQELNGKALSESAAVRECQGKPKILLKLSFLLRVFPLNKIRVQRF